MKHDTVTQLGEGECITLPIKIMNRPDKMTPENVNSNISINASAQFNGGIPTDPREVKIAVDKNALLYYETYVKAWEAYWLKRAPPTVMTP